MSEQQSQGGNAAAKVEHGRETASVARRPLAGASVATGGPHTRPGDQNALCVETDQA